MYPLVSIITVSFNSENTIKQTIESVLKQTYTNIEYLIIDGLSNDSTVKISKRYMQKFKEKGIKYVVISETDDGIYNAMNKGMKLSSGDILGFINSDDWYEPDAIEKIVKIYNETKFEFFYADLRIVKGQKYKIKKAKNKKYVTSRHWNHPTTFITRRLYQKYQFKENGVYGDFDLWLKVRNNNYKIVVLNEVLANYRLGGKSNEKSLKKAIVRIKERYNIYIDNGYSSLYLLECLLVEGIKLIFA